MFVEVFERPDQPFHEASQLIFLIFKFRKNEIFIDEIWR